jgi:hypothetical protein
MTAHAGTGASWWRGQRAQRLQRVVRPKAISLVIVVLTRADQSVNEISDSTTGLSTLDDERRDGLVDAPELSRLQRAQVPRRPG